MLEALFQNTVSALCYELASEQSTGEWEQGLEPPFNDITSFVIHQHSSMPQVLGAGVRLATILFALSGGSLFHRLEPPRRRVRVAAWTASWLGPCRDLMRLYSSLVILALYSRPGVLGR